MTTQLPVLEPRIDMRAPDVSDAVAAAALLVDPIRAVDPADARATGRICVCEMAAALGERENNVSNHLARLRDAGLVRASRHEAERAVPLLRARRGRGGCRTSRSRRRPPMTTLAVRRVHVPFWPTVGMAAVAWLIAWMVNLPLANWAAYDLLALPEGSQFGDAVAFFLYDVPKVLLLLGGIVTARLVPALLRVARTGAARRWPDAASLPGDRGGGGVRGRDPVLLLLGGAPVHRLRRGRGPARASRSPS